MSNLVRYGSYTVDAMNLDSDRASTISGNVIMDLEQGENIVRFLPPPVGVTSPFRITAMHYVDAVPGLDKIVVFACPRAEYRQPCPACTEVERLNKTGNPIDRERAFRINAGMRIYANVVDRKRPESGVKVLAFGKQIQQQLKAIRSSTRRGGDFTDPSEAGFDVIIERTGTGKNDTKYIVQADRQNTPLADSDAEIDEILSQQHDLEQFVNVTPPEELLAYFGAQRAMMGQRPAPRAQVAAPQSPRAVSTGPRIGASVMNRQAAINAPAEDDFPPSYGGQGTPDR